MREENRFAERIEGKGNEKKFKNNSGDLCAVWSSSKVVMLAKTEVEKRN
jgi:hypothetical protein